MWILATAVLTASLLGSIHCVGMCGPLAIWASGASENVSRSRVIVAGTLYHVGRLATYLIAGLIAGAIGSLVDLGGNAIGYQLMAARVVGGLMILVGVYRLFTLVRPKSVVGELQPSRVGGLLVKLRPYVFRLPLTGRALATGLLTTLLPCGWLYLFALVAAGTGSLVMGPIVMLAFWIGTVPALVALVAGTQLLSRKFTVAIPAVAAILLVLAGGYTASGRGFARLNSIDDLHDAAESIRFEDHDASNTIDSLRNTPLPCCQESAQNRSAPQNEEVE